MVRKGDVVDTFVSPRGRKSLRSQGYDNTSEVIFELDKVKVDADDFPFG